MQLKMNGKKVAALIIAIIVIDQLLKFYIKLNYFLGEEHQVIGSWFRLHFVENEGMAWGLKFGGGFGKIALTLFRLAAVIWGTFLIKGFIKKQYHNGFIICAALIYAGALGNLIDSMFYVEIPITAGIESKANTKSIAANKTTTTKRLVYIGFPPMRSFQAGCLFGAASPLNSSVQYSISPICPLALGSLHYLYSKASFSLQTRLHNFLSFFQRLFVPSWPKNQIGQAFYE